ncbi:hypothetical protein P3T76_008153 [Phytophthora citrophthora]|uniref:Uncharacterized protein n=1 Tax=Phytophthora citrophthora TaxID=4793 RepID=A0AAD9LMB4_9STRA|nr:hypothetical protein P3T76_008153 [Phytophthora citrophthora]
MLSHRLDYAETVDSNSAGVVRTSVPLSMLIDDIKNAYARDTDAKGMLEFLAAPSDVARRELTPNL